MYLNHVHLPLLPPTPLMQRKEPFFFGMWPLVGFHLFEAWSLIYLANWSMCLGTHLSLPSPKCWE